jgi:transposase-like protein
MALMIAYGVNQDGEREIMAIGPMLDESEESWHRSFRQLKRRGLKRICLCISDVHAEIQTAIKKEGVGATWQCRKVHFMRNIQAKVPHKEKKRLAKRLKQIWLQQDKKSVLRRAELFCEE